MIRTLLLVAAGAVAASGFSVFAGQEQEPRPLRVGIIGCDTSHVTVFAKMINSPNAKADLAGIKIVAAYPGGSPDLPASRDRVTGFVKTLKGDYGVEIHDSIKSLIENVDVVLLESVDGRPHLDQARAVILAGKPLFIDKPIAGSLVDAIRIFQLVAKHKVPCFSSSALRFGSAIGGLKNNPKTGAILGCDVYGPCSLEEHHPDLFWYGVHGVEMLYAIMGTGCEQVVRVHAKGTDQVTGLWKDGRIGTFRGIRDGKQDYGATVFGKTGITRLEGFGGYEPLVSEICKFFRTGRPPVSAEETLEMFAFMETADESKRRGGAPVAVAEVMRAALAKAQE